MIRRLLVTLGLALGLLGGASLVTPSPGCAGGGCFGQTCLSGGCPSGCQCITSSTTLRGRCVSID